MHPANPNIPAEAGQEASPEGTRDPTEEEANVYERTVMGAMKMLYSEDSFEKVMAVLAQGKDDPIRAVAMVAQQILMMLRKSSKGNITPEILQGAMMEVIAMIAELAEKQGIFTLDESMFTQIAQAVAQSLSSPPESPEAQAGAEGAPEEMGQGMPQGAPQGPPAGGLVSSAQGGM
jgi:hypothetical protein